MAELKEKRLFLLDMDGTIYHGSTLFPTTLPFIKFLEERGIRYAYCSNNTSYSKQEYVARLAKFGIPAAPENFYTATDFLVDTLKSEHPEWKRVFLLGMPAMAAELQEHGYQIVDDEPEAVIVSFVSILSSSFSTPRRASRSWSAWRWSCPTNAQSRQSPHRILSFEPKQRLLQIAISLI